VCFLQQIEQVIRSENYYSALRENLLRGMGTFSVVSWVQPHPLNEFAPVVKSYKWISNTPKINGTPKQKKADLFSDYVPAKGAPSPGDEEAFSDNAKEVTQSSQ